MMNEIVIPDEEALKYGIVKSTGKPRRKPGFAPFTRERRIEMLWALIEKKGPDDCWLWNGCLNENGYGRVRWMNSDGSIVTAYTHRIVYELTYGAIPEGMKILHRCDVPKCNNPFHMFMGTQTDNMKDMRDKGRDRYLFGEDSNRAKLTEAIVFECRKRHKEGESNVVLAAEFGVDRGTMRYAVIGRTWPFVPMP